MVDFYRNKLADNYKLAVSGLFNVPTISSTYDIIRVPHWAFVYDVFFEVVTLDGGGALIEVGFKGNGDTADPNYFLTTTEGVLSAAGIIRPGTGAYAKYFSSASGTITLTTDGTAVTTAQYRVFVGYAVIQ